MGHIGDVTRFPTEHHFDTGSAPLDSSSGKTVRRRLNTGGNRALNSALHIIAICQIRDGGRGQEYYLRKISEGKTPAEARRALKRRLPDNETRPAEPTCTSSLTHRGANQRPVVVRHRAARLGEPSRATA
ncbi:transposase [Streptomyces cyaneofuscatus]|uniref:transposase n=1 Tax=Streptomyces cyaneofuscatus TaxID=66883 RepID=UPI0037FF63FB